MSPSPAFVPQIMRRPFKNTTKKLHYGFSTVASEEVFPLGPARKLWIVFEKEER